MPLPSFSWANGSEVWNCMLEKDMNYSKLRSVRMLERHPSLVESYRAILFDWLSEVSHECKFHRETYHLALDFIDRYLSVQTNVSKLQLQLVGTTCLFLAAKFEEIRPPTVYEFADLTDGACGADEIIDHEVVILSAINWDITPMTPNSWLNTYMQILLNLDKEGDEDGGADENSGLKNDSFIIPANNGIFKSNHKRIASVIDLALLNIESLRFTNSILTASALYYFTDEITVRQCTGYRYHELADCIRWLKPFVETIKEIREPVFVSSCRNEPHSTQMHTHIATVQLLEKTEHYLLTSSHQTLSLKRKEISEDEEDENSPTKPTSLLTPPRSVKRERVRAHSKLTQAHTHIRSHTQAPIHTQSH